MLIFVIHVMTNNVMTKDINTYSFWISCIIILLWYYFKWHIMWTHNYKHWSRWIGMNVGRYVHVNNRKANNRSRLSKLMWCKNIVSIVTSMSIWTHANGRMHLDADHFFWQLKSFNQTNSSDQFSIFNFQSP